MTISVVLDVAVVITNTWNVASFRSMRAEAEILVDRVRKSDTKNGVREMYSNDRDIVRLYPFETFKRF